MAPASPARPIDRIGVSTRANWWTLIAFAILALPIAVVVIVSTVVRFLDDTDERPSRDAQSTTAVEDRSSGNGAMVLGAVGLVAAGCVATPLLIARRQNRAVTDHSDQRAD